MIKDLLRASVNLIPFSVRDWIRHVPGLAMLQRQMIRAFIPNQPFTHLINAGPAAGLHFDVTLPMDKAVWIGTYERKFSLALAGAVKPGAVCYDVGGYRGYMSGVMALAGAAKVVVFDPLPANQQALLRLCELNPNLPIELLPVAVGKMDGGARLKIMSDFSMAKLESSSFQPSVNGLAEIDVAVRRIDSLVNEGRIPPPDVVKVDVEGAELDVLRGAIETLRAFRPIVFLEVHSEVLDGSCCQELANLGYQVQRLESGSYGCWQPCHLMAWPNS